ncbi:hypothetical protein [Achromobacter xylosoxidans]|uniref:hypothetical protein n=1 Tax=Alcaligenes xylosoxydans xylosoxydans TaxID=85698 RepID=UPI00131ABF32|nr:hypothetical protein [Achromobacter xylosoxidans]MCZ8441748.1 hypothetical protein [Achromobacter xylosoxidans]
MQINIRGDLVDLSHLKTLVRHVDLDLRGNLKKKGARVEFRFSNHCYSRGPKKGETIPDNMLVSDGSDKHPRLRIFCDKRYGLSQALVQHIDDLINENRLVQRSRHLNFFAAPLVTVDENGQACERFYYIFMCAKKKQDTNQPPKISIFVESAYPEDPDIPSPGKEGDPLLFSVMLGNIWENRR